MRMGGHTRYVLLRKKITLLLNTHVSLLVIPYTCFRHLTYLYQFLLVLPSQLRDYDWQVLHEAAEREDMYNAECEQCEYDRFWGLDLFIRIQNDEEKRLRKVYEERVAHLNSMLVRTKAVKETKKFSFAKIGTLAEDFVYRDEEMRREAVIRKLKAEEIRSKLKIRVSFSNQVGKL